MARIITDTILVIAALIAPAQYYEYRNEIGRQNVNKRFGILAFSLAVCAFASVLMDVLSAGTLGFAFYAIARICYILVMITVVSATSKVTEISKKNVRLYIYVIFTLTLLGYFADVVFTGGILEKGILGAYVPLNSPIQLFHKIITFSIYLGVLIALIISKKKSIIKRRDRYEVILCGVTFLFAALGPFLEILSAILNGITRPFGIPMGVVSVCIMRKLLIYHEMIRIKPDDYSGELDVGSTDVAFVLDDSMKVIYMNKRAEVLSHILKDDYLGREITDIFNFTEEGIEEISKASDNNAFGMSAVYPIGKRRVNMIVQHRLDRYNEVLSTGVIVYNMEEREKYDEDSIQKDESGRASLIDEALKITQNANILIWDDDSVFMSSFADMLKPYNLRINCAGTDDDLMTSAASKMYDLIFISYESNGKELAQKLRAMDGNYFKQVPIIFITTHDINEVFLDFLEAGFTDYLNKPVSERNLNGVLTRWLWQRQSDQEL